MMMLIKGIKAKAEHLYSATGGSGAVYHRLSGCTAYRPQTKSAATGLWPTTNSHTRPWSAVWWSQLRNLCNYMDFYSFIDPEGM